MAKTNIQKAATHSSDGDKIMLNISDRLALIGLIDEGMRQNSSDSPIVADLFSDLWELINSTVSGSKIDRLKPEDSPNGFHVVEVNAESGENIGRLNMLYLKKPLPSYYLVYVEVSAPFRRKGIGSRILEYFRDFLVEKSALGILDNIIPEDDPTYSIYEKLGWEPIESVTGSSDKDADDRYMVYAPPQFRGKDLQWPLRKLLTHLRRKRAAIDMRDNEMMVRQTIAEFKSLYATLLTYSEADIKTGNVSSLTRFMFTRFVTKLISFRRRIGDLIGYTGGESMEQIALTPEIAAMHIQSYAPKELAGTPSLEYGDEQLWALLPQELKESPSVVIESLPNYRRPSFMAWLGERNATPETPLTLGDLMDLGFDPSRLKEITINGQDYIFERIQSRLIPTVENKARLFSLLGPALEKTKAHMARIIPNPPLLIIRNRGNAYVLWRRVDGIHWDEAVEQAQCAPELKALNATVNLDRKIKSTVARAKQIVAEHTDDVATLNDIAWFVPWDLKNNRPKMVVDFSGSSLEAVWMT